MTRAVLTALLAAAVATSAHALDYSPQLDREYTDRLLTMDDTAAAHVALARWCEGVGALERGPRFRPGPCGRPCRARPRPTGR